MAAEAARMAGEVRFVDTTFRDGHASLWAERMSTRMMLAVATEMDAVGFAAMEVIAPSHFKKCVRELREDPWQRVRALAGKVVRTPLAALSMVDAPSTFGFSPPSISRLWAERLAANGIRRMQLVESSNDMSNRVDTSIAYARAAGLTVVMGLVYTLSPRHTDRYYAEKAAQAVRLGVDGLYLKDPGGLLTPDRVRTLIPAILGSTGGLPLEIHSHCTTGLAPLCYLEALKAGVRTVHTAVPPLANGSSQPSLPNVARNARILGFSPAFDGTALPGVTEELTRSARLQGLPLGEPVEYDHAQYLHQVPGGVISNLRHQLSAMGLLPRLPAVLEESIRVRRELGYPIMVTPFSQLVVSQATVNVWLGERYREVVDEVIRYCLGHYGKEVGAGAEPDVLDRILGRSRARELSTWVLPDPSIDEVRRQIGGPGVTDDELLLRFMVGGQEEIARMRREGPSEAGLQAGSSVVALLRDLASRTDIRRFSLERPGFSLALAARSEPQVRTTAGGSGEPPTPCGGGRPAGGG